MTLRKSGIDGISINANKTKYMVMKDGKRRGASNLDNYCSGNGRYVAVKIEHAEYLGVTITRWGNEEK